MPIKKDKRKIPKGYYCYFDIHGKRCPYWSIRKGKPKQNNGYCAYLEKGDWDLNKEDKWQSVYTHKGKKDTYGPSQTAYEIGFYMSLLWDQVKECNVKDKLCVEEAREIKREIKKHGKNRIKKRT